MLKLADVRRAALSTLVIAAAGCAPTVAAPAPPASAPPQTEAPPLDVDTSVVAHLPLAAWTDLAVLESTLAHSPGGPFRLEIDRFPLGPRNLVIAQVLGPPAQGAAIVLLSCDAAGLRVLAIRQFTRADHFSVESRWTTSDGRFGLLLATWSHAIPAPPRFEIAWEVLRLDGESLTTALAGISSAWAAVRLAPGAAGLSLVRCERGASSAALLDLARGRFGQLRPSSLPCIPAGRPEWLSPPHEATEEP